jgi:membrane-bound lytic murein transglycosylase F
MYLTPQKKVDLMSFLRLVSSISSFCLLFLLLADSALANEQILRIGTTGHEKIAGLPRSLSPIQKEKMLLERFAEQKNYKLQIQTASSLDELFSMLKQGKIDIAYGNLSITPEREKLFAFSAPVDKTHVSIVSSKQTPGVGRHSLAGKKIFIEYKSSYWRLAEKLKKQMPSIKLVTAPLGCDTEELLYCAGRRKIPYAIADDNFIECYTRYRADLKVIYTFPEAQQSAFVLNKNKLILLKELNTFIKKHRQDFEFTYSKQGWAAIKRRGYIRVLTRSNPFTYFIHRGKLMGFEYELAKKFAKEHNLRLVVIVPPTWQEMFDWLQQGKGDVIAAMVTVSDARKKISGISFCYPYCNIKEQIIAKKGTPAIRSLRDLNGKKIAVRYGSSYYFSLKKLQANGIKVKIIPLSPSLETDEILEKVIAGKYRYTMSDDNIFASSHGGKNKLHSIFTLPHNNNYGWMVRTDNAKLKDKVNEFFKRTYRGVFFNLAYRRYFSTTPDVKTQTVTRNTSKEEISRYDNIIKQYSGYYAFPWCLIASQIYQESRFNAEAKAWDGGMGLMQLMPATARELGCHDPFSPAQNVNAGVKYMNRLKKRFDDKVSPTDKFCFALASYNGGYGHVIDARKLAEEQGLNPNRWHNNVEKSFKLLSKKKYASKARYGSCRSHIIIDYVNDIMIRYHHYFQQVSQKKR